jgi:hypothetical protein
MTSWISRKLLTSNGSNQGMLQFHFKGYFLAKSIESKYEEPEIYRLYVALLADPLKTNDFNKSCLQNFQKSCDALTADESVQLEIMARTGLDANRAGQIELKRQILEKCN